MDNHTRILTRDHRMVSIPNAFIGKNRIINHSIPSNVFRVETHVSVAYGTDIDNARRVIDKLNTAVYQALNEANIDIPLPQRVVHVHGNGHESEPVPMS